MFLNKSSNYFFSKLSIENIQVRKKIVNDDIYGFTVINHCWAL